MILGDFRVASLGWATTLSVLLLAGCAGVDGSQSDDAATQDTAGAPPASAAQVIDRALVVIGTDTVDAELAVTAAQRAQGLMERESLPEGTGMLFIYESEATRSFWMKDTYIPLDIAYIDSGQRIIDIQQMEPMTTDSHPSAGPFLYALEVPQGWFEARGIEVGDRVEIVYGGR